MKSWSDGFDCPALHYSNPSSLRSCVFMKVFITGGTGFVGREVLRQLHPTGHEARLLVRDRKAAADRLPQPSRVADLQKGDVTDLRSLTDSVKGCEAVIHLVGIISEGGPVTFDRLHVEATRNVVAAAQAGGVGRFLHMSALGTCEDARSRYHQTKWEAEQVVRRSGLRYTILRPSVIYGPEDHFVKVLASMAHWLPILPVPGSGRNQLQPVAVEDVARCFVEALAGSKSIGQTYEVCGPDRLTMDAMLDAVTAVIGRRRVKFHFPMPLMKLQAVLAEWIFGGILNRPPPLTRDQLLMLEEDNVGDPRPAVEDFKLLHETFAKGIGRYLRSSA